VGGEGIVDIPVPDDGRSLDIGRAAKATGVRVPPKLAAWLAQRHLAAIDDVRWAGGMAPLAKLPVKPDSAGVAMIDGLAALATLPGDVERTAKVVRKGYWTHRRHRGDTRADVRRSARQRGRRGARSNDPPCGGCTGRLPVERADARPAGWCSG